MKLFCVQCGVAESVKTDAEVKRAYEDMDTYLKFLRKKRIQVKGDGHCLPRAVFRGAKHHNLLPEYVKYSSLLKEAVDQIKLNIKQYAGILTEGEEVAKNALEKFVVEKNYNVESNIVDAIINELAKITSCTIKVHYQCGDGSFDYHAIPPMDPPLPDTPCIELAFINAHYDFVSDIAKAEKSTSSALELNKRLRNRGEDH